MPPPLFSKPTCSLLVIIIAIISIPLVRLPSDLYAISIPTLVTHAASPLAPDRLTPALSHRTKPPWYRFVGFFFGVDALTTKGKSDEA
nr:hypothetical protein CFP56_45370 [Quercus suber]